MRIPVYRAQASLTTATPGRSITARKDPRPFIQQAQQQGEVIGAALSEVGQYAKMRYDSEQDLLLSQGLLEAEEGIRMSADDLSKTSRPSNVFGGDKLWDQQTGELRDSVLDKIGSDRFTRSKFLERFNQMELSARFQLKGQIDDRIEKMDQATMARRQERIVQKLSQVGLGDPAAMIKEYQLSIAGISADLNTGVTKGRYNAEGVSKVNLAMRKQIAKNITSAYVGSDPLFAGNLLEALEIQDLIAAGAEITDDMLPNIPGGDYVLFALSNIPRDDAIDILSSALTDANKFAKLREDAEKRNEAAVARQITAVKNRYAYFENDKTYTINELTDFVPNILDHIEIKGMIGEDKAFGSSIRSALREYLTKFNELTPETESLFDKLDNEDPTFAIHPAKTEQTVYNLLFGYKQRGELTIGDVNRNKRSLTQEDFKYFMNSIDTTENETLAAVKRFAKSKFQYDETTALDPDFGKAAKAAYYNVIAGLEEAVITADTPYTKSALFELAKELIEEESVVFEQMMRSDYIGTIDQYNSLYGGVGLDLSYEDPLADLQEWFTNVADQNDQNANYARIRGNLKREFFDKGFVY
jgi:ribosomal protein S20